MARIDEQKKLRLNLMLVDYFAPLPKKRDSEDEPAVSANLPAKNLRPRFLDMSITILPLRALPHGDPFDLVTFEGAAGGQLPLCAAVHDHRVAKAIEQRGFLFVAFSMPDLASLLAVGLPAALAAGLDEITPASVAELRDVLGLSETNHAGPAAAESSSLAVGPGGTKIPTQSRLRTGAVRPPDAGLRPGGG